MEHAREMNTKRTAKSNSKRGKGLPRRAQDMSKEELLLTLQKKKECNARALKIVERMLEPHVEEDWFIDVLQHINQSHFQDVTEERAITKICGYPMCSNELNDIPSQQYRISTKLNKVYDIKERKNFCSNMCFKASKFIKDQMYSSPLWLRDIEPKLKFSLMPSTQVGGGAGDEISVEIQRVHKSEIHQITVEKNLTSKTKGCEESSLCVKSSLDTVQNLLANSSIFPNTSDQHAHLNKDSLNEVTNQNAVNDLHTQDNLDIVGEGRVMNCSFVEDEGNQEKVEENKAECSKLLSHLTQTNCSKLNTCVDSVDKRKELILQRNDFDNIVPHEGNILKCSEETLNKSKSHEVCENAGSRCLESKSVPNVLENSASVEKNTKDEKAYNPANCETGNGMKTCKDSNRKLKNDASCSDSGQKAKGKKSLDGTKSTKKQLNSVSSVSLTTVSHVEHCVQEWFTMETMCFLFGESALKHMLEQKGESIQEHYRALRSVTWDQEKHERFLAICKRLNLLEMEDSNFDSQMMKTDTSRLKPLPDYTALKKEAETMELKIRAFYKGQIEIDEKKVSFAEDAKSESTDHDEPQIPLVHLHSQRALRKKIVLDGLNRVLPDFLRTFGMRPSDLTGSVRGLIGTFALSATNITFKPQEWSLLGLIIIKLLCLREPELKKCLQSEQSNTYMTLMLMSYKQEPGYLDHLLTWLTDIDKLLAKPQLAKCETVGVVTK